MLLLLLLILYIFIFNLHCVTASTNYFSIANTANCRASDTGFIWNLLSGSEKVVNTSLFLV